MWVPDPQAFIKLLTHEAPPFLGAWCLLGIVAASMSTADGAILAMGTVFTHNILRQFSGMFPSLITSDNLLSMARLATIPFTLTSTLIAVYYRTSHSAGATGYLLIVAFDVVLATVVPPLFGAFYAKNPSPRAAFCSILTGAILRTVLEYALPKDGFLLLPFKKDEFLDYGPAASAGVPTFFDALTEDVWNPEDATQQCVQARFEDFTGVDSLASFLGAILVFVAVQSIENMTGKPLFNLSGLEGYFKETDQEAQKAIEVTDVTTGEA
jgi:Na+/proline symporter